MPARATIAYRRTGTSVADPDPARGLPLCGDAIPVYSEATLTFELAMLVNSPSRNTYGNIASRLAVGLAATGRVTTTIVCYSEDPAPPWLPPEVKIHRLGATRASRSLRPLVRYLRHERPDVLITRQVHANLMSLVAVGAARLPPGWHGKLVLAHEHPVELSHASDWKDNKWLVKAGYRLADGIITVSPTVRENVIDWCGVDPSSVELVPNPIIPFGGRAADPPHPWLEPGCPPVFVSTANLMAWKRMDLLIDAFDDVRSRHDVRLLIIGEGTERPRLVAQIERLGLGDRVQTLGWVEDPRQFAARAQAFVLASDEEGFSQVITEAMSTGCPVITTDALGGGPRYVTENGRYAILVPRSDRAGLVGAMEKVLQPEVRMQYASLGRERVEVFSPLVCANTLVDFLERRVMSTPER